MTQETQTAAIICDRCGENTDTDGRGPRFGSLSASWGLGSQHPGEKYELSEKTKGVSAPSRSRDVVPSSLSTWQFLSKLWMNASTLSVC